MENAITGLIVIGVLVLAILGLSEQSLSAHASISDSIRQMQDRLLERGRTDITPVSAVTMIQPYYVQVTVKNTGQVKLADFDHWDAIVQYTDMVGIDHVNWYGYPSGWTETIDQDGQPEVFEKGILNPGEEIVLTIHLPADVQIGSINRAIIATPNGITASTVFTR
jgi:hypothetical protein